MRAASIRSLGTERNTLRMMKSVNTRLAAV